PVGLYPWYEVPGRVERDLKVVCGHWSTLGLFIGHGVHAIDTGAVWGGKLTALQLDTQELRIVQVPGRDVPATPPRPRPPYHPGNRDQRQPPRPGNNGRRNGRGEQRGGRPRGPQERPRQEPATEPTQD
ncbi:MAG: bis(5'-nucleosyl)-tetraphosphatase, partial [Lysobacter sp.]|nr:bis(5'-nucleosyl)-tetraphosphatase [Lysobacter sp.]